MLSQGLHCGHGIVGSNFVQEIKAAAAEKDGKKAEAPEETPVQEVQEIQESEEGYKPGKLT